MIQEKEKEIMITGFNFKKKFGQNFISDKNLLSAIVADSGIDNNSQVLEIGAGAGTLTEQLAQVASKVVAIEIDKDLTPYLQLLCDRHKNITLIFDDFMRVSKETIEEHFDKKFDVVANLPYYITTPIIFKLIEEGFNINSLTIMVQKEVAERFVADCNCKEYGAVSVMIQSQADLKITRVVPRSMFYPQPNVDSAVINIKINPNKYNISNKENFSKVVKTAFNYRRKTLCNALQLGLNIDRESAEKMIASIGLPVNIRGEKLTIQQFIDLSNCL